MNLPTVKPNVACMAQRYNTSRISAQMAKDGLTAASGPIDPVAVPTMIAAIEMNTESRMYAPTRRWIKVESRTIQFPFVTGGWSDSRSGTPIPSNMS